MLRFECYELPGGIPVYYERLPDLVQSVSLRWLVFTGSADDVALRAPGIYHWFEHVPSRGTRKYPNGYADTERRLSAGGGDSDGHTAHTYTAFSAWVPDDHWRAALDVLTDMIAAPLLGDAGIDAERPAILEEFFEVYSSADSFADYHLPGILWPGHPLGHHPLGAEETIRSCHSNELRRAFSAGYARSRMVLVAAGAIDPAAFLDEAARCAERIPDLPLSERRRPASYGTLPAWTGGARTEVETDFDTSTVRLLFPVPPAGDSARERLPWVFLTEMCAAGGLGSPLYRVLREDRGLVYGADVEHAGFPDGGYWGFVAQTSPRNVERVIDGFWKVLRDPEMLSAEWGEYVRDSIRGYMKLRGLDPEEHAGAAEGRLAEFGEVWSDDEYLARLLTLGHSDMTDFAASLKPAMAHAIVFRGSDRSAE